MYIKTPISRIENPIFMLLILINTIYALIPIVGSVLKFYVVFLNMLIFQTIWRNKNEHLNTKSIFKKEKKVRIFKNLNKFTIERLRHTLPISNLKVFTVLSKTEPRSIFRTRYLVLDTVQPSSVGNIRVSLSESSVVEWR